MKKFKIFLYFTFAFSFLFTYYVYAYDLPKWFPFNQENALQEWQEKIFNNRVLYTIELEENPGFLVAKSEKACSGLLYKLKFNVDKSPMISWHWKVTKFPKKGIDIADIEERGGWIEKDDYAARVYVIFPSWNFMNIKSLEYVWDETLPEGTVMTSPYSKNIKLIVVESGAGKLDQWVFEERNILEDYHNAFQRKPRTIRVGAIALMTDADNTLSTAEAFYKNLNVGYRLDKSE